ncbi:hypothetical protein LCGC14_2228880 [marine sediment metagenome]|uniref:Uncharacterized protein n=1 Tax=marine sediment metagenome TaxID=412755 RepID=A0A0F9D8Y5_9ZZZZ
MKRHPKTKEILTAMDKWAKEDNWPDGPLRVWHKIEDSLGLDSISVYYKDWSSVYIGGEYEEPKLNVIHFLPNGCESDDKYAYCARPGAGKVTKHKIGNCPLAKG